MRITSETTDTQIAAFVAETCTTQAQAQQRLHACAQAAGLTLDDAATVARVNRVLAKAGYVERLQAGRGYYYWREGNGLDWPSVYEVEPVIEPETTGVSYEAHVALIGVRRIGVRRIMIGEGA